MYNGTLQQELQWVLSIGWVYRCDKNNNITITGGVVAQQINSNYILRFTTKRELSGQGLWSFKYITVLLRNPFALFTLSALSTPSYGLHRLHRLYRLHHVTSATIPRHIVPPDLSWTVPILTNQLPATPLQVVVISYLKRP